MKKKKVPRQTKKGQSKSKPKVNMGVKKPKLPLPTAAAKNIIPILIEDEMRSSYIDYAMSVIVGRALPDIRDGLKPVHRRILFSMNEQGMNFGKPFKKSARVVGDVLGKYHPHGDTAIYDSLVRMAQDFALRYPLINGQGNFGSVDGDGAAAMRYTEARMSKIAEELITDIEKDTVDFIPNFDESTQEPVVMPSKIPNLLLNGAAGIAVGMATNIPPHNLSEISAALIAFIKNQSISNKQLMKYVQGPDFPTGGTICGQEGIKSMYETGKGSIKIRAAVSVEPVPHKKDRDCIIVTEIPYQVNKSNLIIRIADLVRDKKIKGITDLRDESGREGLRIYIEIKKGASSALVLNQLYKHTALQVSFGANMLALIDGEPKVCMLKTFIEEFVKYRVQIVVRRTKFELKKAEDRAHILEGLLIALSNLDAVIKLIKTSKTVEAARDGLIKKFKLSKIQAQAILDMKLQRLTALETQKIKEEHKNLLLKIKDLKDILKRKERIYDIITKETQEMSEKYGDPRRTNITGAVKEMKVEDLIPKQEVAIFITLHGFIKRLPVQTFRNQMRGGRGVAGMDTREEDVLEKIYITSTLSQMMCFTNYGRVYGFKAYDIPDASRQSKGQSIENFLELSEGEHVTSAIAVEKFLDTKFLVMATKNGIIKKTQMTQFSNLRKSGIIAINLDKGDELLFAGQSEGNQDVLIGTSKGLMIRFKEKNVRPMGRSSKGVRAIKIKKDDNVIGMKILEQGDDEVLIISEKGYGKRTPLKEYKSQGRGGKGIKAMTIKPAKTGNMARMQAVNKDDEVLIVTSGGTVSKQKVKNISIQHRAASGVIIQRVSKDDEKIVDIAKVLKLGKETKTS